MDIGIIALILAAVLFIWGMVSLGRNSSKKKRNKRRDDDDDMGAMMMFDWNGDLDIDPD